MKIIITEDQSNTISDKLKSMVKQIGWEKTSKSVGSPKNLSKLGFNNDPMEFLNLFNDLNVVQSEQESYLVLYCYEKGNNLMVYDRDINEISISHDVIWLFLKKGFGLKWDEIQNLTKEWLGEVYNLRGVTTFSIKTSVLHMLE
jgi:hypothetical protein